MTHGHSGDNGVLVNASDIFSCRYMLCAEYVTVGMSVNGQEVPGGRRNGNKLSSLEFGPRSRCDYAEENRLIPMQEHDNSCN
jgi:hypothetical protein